MEARNSRKETEMNVMQLALEAIEILSTDNTSEQAQAAAAKSYKHIWSNYEN